MTRSSKKQALLVGATGLIGSYLLKMLLEDEQYEQINVLTRRDLEIKHAKLNATVIDFENLEHHANLIQGDDLFITLGITKKKAGSIEAAYKVEFTYPHQIAQIAQANGAKQCLIVSSIGANANSKNYYFKAKGEVENALMQIPFESLHILRPSILLGPRKEIRLAEDLGKVTFMAFATFIPNRYKAIQGKTVAKFMQLVASKALKGINIFESEKIRRIERKTFDFQAFQEKTVYREI